MGWRANAFMAFWTVFVVFLQDSASSQVVATDAEAEDWTRALTSDTAEAYFEFLMTHPRGAYFEEAVSRLYVIGALKPVDDMILNARNAALLPVPKKKTRPAKESVRSAPVPDAPVSGKKQASMY